MQPLQHRSFLVMEKKKRKGKRSFSSSPAHNISGRIPYLFHGLCSLSLSLSRTQSHSVFQPPLHDGGKRWNRREKEKKANGERAQEQIFIPRPTTSSIDSRPLDAIAFTYTLNAALPRLVFPSSSVYCIGNGRYGRERGAGQGIDTDGRRRQCSFIQVRLYKRGTIRCTLIAHLYCTLHNTSQISWR